MSDGGKGSRQRPKFVDQKTFDENWNKIFNNEYQDILSTEDCLESVLDKELKNQRDKD